MSAQDDETTPGRAGRQAAARDEPRAARTREALITVLRRHLRAGGGPLSVAEVCRRAGIHRVTFYGHWPDLDAALDDAATTEVDALGVTPEAVLSAATTPVELARTYRAQLQAQLEEVRAHREVYRGLFRAGGLELRLQTSMRTRAEDAIAQLRRLGVDTGDSLDVAAGYLAAGAAASYRDWAFSDEQDVDLAAARITAQLPAWWPQA
ncbi:hypothetical protein [Nocardioides bruguierae]|uniref:TetR/AcrR family transcriptional regulator n=1 Tax=Nocardioides bruguierae TaxID=2945102 RepID=A0A9X2D8V4_9ACTN|nr:hypothetical protein [Nocardioides bruguierae]MCM0621438.1 hypothetical protein [Nocardioides bruguierae]